ncbi:MAG: IS4-like element ISLpn5 family transposase [Polyangiales bacterium]
MSQVFTQTREREGAYDLLQNEHVLLEDVAGAMFEATVSRVQTPFVYAAIDGSSLNLTDEAKRKGFGRIGSDAKGARGLKVMSALAIHPDGVPLGLIDQQYWSRPDSSHSPANAKEKEKRNRGRFFTQKETVRFVRAAEKVVERLQSASVRAWVVIDREADNHDILLGVSELDCHFTLRGNWERLVAESDLKVTVRGVLAAQPILGSYDVEIGRTGQRAARMATMNVRAKEVELRLRNHHGKGREKRLLVTAVWVTETEASIQKGGTKALEWLLYTNVHVQSSAAAQAVVRSYACRWRIEEFHRTWKSGACRVEDMQLRSVETATIWATILAANAARIERLKYLARTTPDAPATSVLRPVEIETLKRLRRSEKKNFGDGPINLLLVTEWIAELGGWIRRNGPPGAITLSRGLERLMHYTKGFELASAGLPPNWNQW